MKKILFVINSLTIGGSEKSLVSLLNLIDYSKYEVDLLMFKKGEEFEKYIPKEVNVLEVPKYYKYISSNRTQMSSLKKLGCLNARIKTAINLRVNSKKKVSINTEQVLYKSQKNVLDNIDKEYDVAIAYSQGMPTYFVVDKVNAKKKIAWINCDYATTMYDKEFDYKYYMKVDKIVVVSKTIKESIISLKSEYEKKIEIIFDIVNPKLIEKMAKEEVEFRDENCVNILTVARLVIHYKGYDLAIKAAKMLKDNDYKFKWFVVGDGPDRKKLEQLIEEYKINDCFILLGKKDNPYPYMKKCDLYVQPSKKEGFGLTVIEAKILKRPIICTNFNTAKELIKNEEDGLIVGQDKKEIYIGIKRYIENNDFKNKIIKQLNVIDSYSSVKEIEKVYKIIEE